MKPIRVAINGFGRIGRNLLRILIDMSAIEVVAINDLSNSYSMAHLFKFDSVHGKYSGYIRVENNAITIDGKTILCYSESDPGKLPWEKLNIDLVIESTGKLIEISNASKHLLAGARRVIITAPSFEDGIKMIVIGVNDQLIEETDRIISNASCTSHCVAPMIKVLEDNWGINKIFISTIHSYTNDQNLQDTLQNDLRRSRAAGTSIIPTTTGAVKIISSLYPQLKDKVEGCGIRVPVVNGALTDITCMLNGSPTIEELNTVFKAASENSMKGIIEYTEEPLVSIDIVGNRHSCIYDAGYTSTLGNMIKIMGWYDNETGYSSRIADLIKKMFAIN